MYYLWLNESQAGPFSLEQVRGWWADGTVTAQTLFWQTGMAEWTPLSTIHEQLSGPPPGRVIGNFWRRSAAYTLDSLILGLPAQVVAVLCFGFFLKLGAWGLLFGFVVAAAYFGLFNSR